MWSPSVFKHNTNMEQECRAKQSIRSPLLKHYIGKREMSSAILWNCTVIGKINNCGWIRMQSHPEEEICAMRVERHYKIKMKTLQQSINGRKQNTSHFLIFSTHLSGLCVVAWIELGSLQCCYLDYHLFSTAPSPS